ncbi:Uncharacterised protein [Mycobacteroides abscessus subsp. abscessus]|nr:Uncharacterised protein [Mycobacteroides abscessus subsp. abscessus]
MDFHKEPHRPEEISLPMLEDEELLFPIRNTVYSSVERKLIIFIGLKDKL